MFSGWKALGLMICFMIAASVCDNTCNDADDCHAADDSVACVCDCHSPLALLPEPMHFERLAPSGNLACAAPATSPLLSADIYRPPAC